MCRQCFGTKLAMPTGISTLLVALSGVERNPQRCTCAEFLIIAPLQIHYKKQRYRECAQRLSRAQDRRGAGERSPDLDTPRSVPGFRLRVVVTRLLVRCTMEHMCRVAIAAKSSVSMIMLYIGVRGHRPPCHCRNFQAAKRPAGDDMLEAIYANMTS